MTVRRLYDIFTASAGVCTDSRNVVPGSLFFALRGDRFDGNSYAADALRNGAAYAVVDDPGIALTDRYILVGNTLDALQELASFHRNRLGIPVLAVTGTNGKTTTKELIACVLGTRFWICATRGNLNNHIGVPLTLLSMSGDTQLGIVEMGASAPGEIGTLCRIAAPDHGLITNVGLAHLAGFGSSEGVKRAKGELYDYLAAHGGTAFIPVGDPCLMEMAAARPGLKTVPYSADAAIGLKSGLEGEYNRANIAAAVAVSEFFGVPGDAMSSAIAGYMPDNHRSQKVTTAHNTLLLDCYNANPSSMRTAIENFAAHRSLCPKAVILGDMHELGGYSAREHETVLQLLEQKGICEIYLIGGNFIAAVDSLSVSGRTAKGVSDRPAGVPAGVAAVCQAPDSDLPAPACDHFSPRTFGDVWELRRFLSSNPLRDRFILVKGSRAAALENVTDLL